MVEACPSSTKEIKPRALVWAILERRFSNSSLHKRRRTWQTICSPPSNLRFSRQSLSSGSSLHLLPKPLIMMLFRKMSTIYVLTMTYLPVTSCRHTPSEDLR